MEATRITGPAGTTAYAVKGGGISFAMSEIEADELRDSLLKLIPLGPRHAYFKKDESSRRERIAAAVLAAIAADDRCFTGDETAEEWKLTVQYRANAAVSFADALIRALDKE